MLQICDIRKQYKTGDLVQTALDGVSLKLRDNEFVAVLGPSGSGKTTLLNVIGGLDRYDSGDLIINGISTRKYSDRDWDSYRNHTIGFVFQSYNLIPHQTVLANVELALTISGISRAERKMRAKKALEEVGLGDQLHKKPNQMSGGQMQRVAIARALVNDPDILLADEPTGALDSETSIQVMELLKAVSKDRLVVMVTHNPELAETYANRIVRVRDGRIIDDTNPFEPDTEQQEPPKHKNMGKASMSWFTALSLSFNNLRTKKGRTILTSFAGSIGIIGIALIMSLSTGFQKYVDKIQEDTLSNYPLSIQSETADMTAAMSAFGSMLTQTDSVTPGTVVEQQMISQMFAQIGTNDLASFKTYLEDNYDEVSDVINDVKYSYGIKPLIYAADTSEDLFQVNPGVLFGELTGSSAMSAYMDSDIFYQMIDNTELLSSQYEVLKGRWPQSSDEMIIVLSSPNQITDYMAYTLGIKNADSLFDMIKQVMEGLEVENNEKPMQWTYQDLMDLEFRLVPETAKYKYNEEYKVWEDMSKDQAYMKQLVDNGETLRIVGIVCPKDGVSATTLSPGVAYTADLTEKVINVASESEIVKKQMEDPKTDVFTGKPFDSEQTDSELKFEDMITIDQDKLSSAFGMDMDEDAILALLVDYMESALSSMQIDTTPAQKDFLDTLSAVGKWMLDDFVRRKADPVTGEATLYISEADEMVDDYLATITAIQMFNDLEDKYQLPREVFTAVYKPLLVTMVAGYIAENMTPIEIPDVTVPDVTTPTLPDVTIPDITIPDMTIPDVTIPDVTLPTMQDVTLPDWSDVTWPDFIPSSYTAAQSNQTSSPANTDTNEYSLDLDQVYAVITADKVDATVDAFLGETLVTGTASVMAGRMMRATAQSMLMEKLAGFGNVLMNFMGSNFYVDEDILSSAFQFNMTEEELRRLMDTMSGTQKERSAAANLRQLGYAGLGEPTSIAVYFVDFAGKEEFMSFLDNYNEEMERAGKEDQVISYTDMTGIMMSSVRTIIDSVSYVLIAFVAVSLIVSSIMIGIITYISVMERTKEIGVLRAIGASKRNISQVFNAETFIIGLCSGLIGVGLTLVLNIPINHIIHTLTETTDINAQLPALSAVVLIILSMTLTLIGGLIPSKHAARKDPVIALRSE